jgi:ArsR family transcriptional regulator
MREEEVRVVSLFKALSNPVRYKIIKLLADGEYTVTELADEIRRDSQNISQHLRILRQQNLVRYRTEGKQVYYWLKRRGILKLIDLAQDFVKRK